MDSGEPKGNPRSRPATPPPARMDDEHLGPDLAFEMSLPQEVQEERDHRSAAVLSTIESETEEEEEEVVASDGGEEDRYGYFFGDGFEGELGFDPELGFLEGEGSSPSDIDMAEFDDIDPDELSYEELIELGEIIGEEKRGLSLEQIGKCFRPCTFQSRSLAETKNGAIDRCVICQIEYEEGEKLVVLDSCEHPYHSDCITQWLQVKKTCPICSSEVSTPKKSLT